MAHTANSQSLDSINVTIELKNENLKTLFKKIEKQTGLLFAYRSNQIETFKSISLPLGTRSVKTTLDLVLEGTPLRYTQVNTSVIISSNKNFDVSDSTIRRHATIVSGTVRDVTGNPLPGVNILVKGTIIGAATSGLGTYTIEANPDDVLIFSFIGFKRMEELVGERTVIDIVMVEDAQTLQEVEIVGTSYTTTSKELSTSSIVKVTSKDIERQPVTSPLMALQGRVAGLEINPGSGAAGSAPTIRIRGNNSLRTTGSFPLYIIDGIAVESTPINEPSNYLRTGGDPLSTINPANIESIEVLKDADATSIYGSRGANGVIIIRTKQAKLSDATAFDLSAYAGVGQIGNWLDQMNSSQYLEMRRTAFKNDNLTPDVMLAPDLVLWDTTRHTNWQKKLLGGSANITDFQGNFMAGNGSTSFRAGLGYHKETTIFPGDFGYWRANGSLGVVHNSTNRKFRLNLLMNYGHEKKKNFDGNFIGAVQNMVPVAPPLYDQNGDLNWAPRPDGTSSFQNPLAQLEPEYNSSTSNLMSNAELSYDLFRSISLKANLGFTDYRIEGLATEPISSQAPENRANYTGQAVFMNTKRNSWLIEPQLMIDKVNRNHSIVAVIGATYQNSNNSYQALYADGYTSDLLLGSFAGAVSYNADEDIRQYKYLSLFVRAQYGYKEKYLLSVSGRRDGSSRFGPDKRFGNFYSIAPAWIISNEPFLKNTRVISFGKIRGSFGVTGNDQIGDYKYYNAYTFSGTYQGSNTLTTTGLFNPDFAWEETRKIETAFELGFFDNRISTEVNWYRNRSSNQLVDYQLPATTGFPDIFFNFNATIENSGWEWILKTVNVINDKFEWTTTFNISFPRNQLLEFNDIETSSYSTIYKVGESLSIQRLYTWTGVDPVTGRHTFLDVDQDGTIDDNDKRFMNALDKKYYGGIQNSLHYSGFEFSVLFQFVSQIARTYNRLQPGRIGNQLADVNSYWRNEGDQTNYAKPSQSPTSPTRLDFVNLGGSNYDFTNAMFLRLKTITLSYTVPIKVLDRLSIKDMRIYLQGQNILTITDYPNYDPETAVFVPPLRMITVGVQVKF